MSNQKRIGLEGNDQGVRRLLENYRNDPESIEQQLGPTKPPISRA